MSDWIDIDKKHPIAGQVVILSLDKVVQEVTFMFDGDDFAWWFEVHESDAGHDLIVVGETGRKIMWQPLPKSPA